MLSNDPYATVFLNAQLVAVQTGIPGSDPLVGIWYGTKEGH